MHTFTKVLIILNLVLCLILSQFVWISLAENTQWRERYEAEREVRQRAKARLATAYNDLSAIREVNRNSMAQISAESAALNATRQALQAQKAEADLSRDEAVASANALLEAIRPFAEISSGYSNDVVAPLTRLVEQLNTEKKNRLDGRSELLGRVSQAHNSYAERHEQYRLLEFQQFLMQEELENRRDLVARFRWLRPDIQSDIGDNGPFVAANVTWVDGNSVRLNKGARDGVERGQKYTITRSGVTIAVVNVVDVQNEGCECLVVDLVKRDVQPQRGDEAVTRLFMSRVTSRPGN